MTHRMRVLGLGVTPLGGWWREAVFAIVEPRAPMPQRLLCEALIKTFSPSLFPLINSMLDIP